jgi:hypothetical protein
MQCRSSGWLTYVPGLFRRYGLALSHRTPLCTHHLQCSSVGTAIWLCQIKYTAARYIVFANVRLVCAQCFFTPPMFAVPLIQSPRTSAYQFTLFRFLCTVVSLCLYPGCSAVCLDRLSVGLLNALPVLILRQFNSTWCNEA